MEVAGNIACFMPTINGLDGDILFIFGAKFEICTNSGDAFWQIFLLNFNDRSLIIFKWLDIFKY